MNDYMRENKIEPVPPQLNAQGVSMKSTDGDAADSEPAPTKSAKDAKAH
jgi:hypothetical protein